jgi:hypothetical protein
MFGIVGKAYATCDSSQSGIDLGDCLQISSGVPISAIFNSPAAMINLIVRNVFVLGGVVIFFLIIYAGFKFIQEGTKGKEEAQKILTAAVTGAIVMFSAYWIVQIIEVLTGVNVSL